jgi:hypothetical protein
MIIENIQLLLPKALLNGDFVQYRKYDFKVYVNRQNNFVFSRIDKIVVRPSWTKFYIEHIISGRTIESYGTLDGVIEPAIELSEFDYTDIQIWNESVDTEAFITFNIKSWQFGEL